MTKNNNQPPNGSSSPQQDDEPTVSQKEQHKLLRESFSCITDCAVNKMQGVSKRAESIPMFVVLAIGAAMIIFAPRFQASSRRSD
jgi:hypothetical protein